jgi:hypothetical protein
LVASLNCKPGVRVGRSIRSNELAGYVERLAKLLQIEDSLGPAGLRVAARQIAKKRSFEVEPDDFLNSFFLSDLGRLAGEALASNVGSALEMYLAEDGEVREEERRDTRSSFEDLWQNMSPGMIPTARWPAEATRIALFQSAVRR